MRSERLASRAVGYTGRCASARVSWAAGARAFRCLRAVRVRSDGFAAARHGFGEAEREGDCTLEKGVRCHDCERAGGF